MSRNSLEDICLSIQMAKERSELDDPGSSATPQETGGNGQEASSAGPASTTQDAYGSYRLTIKHPPSINIRECLSEETKKRCSSCLKTSLRLVAVAVVFLVVLACCTVSKLSLFYLEVKLYTFTGALKRGALRSKTASMSTERSTGTSCDPEDPTEETVVIWLALILVIPYVIAFLRCVWNSIMNWNYEPKPACRKVLLGTVVAIFEVLSLAALVLRALPSSPSVGLIVVDSVFMFAVLAKAFSIFDINGIPSWNQAEENSVAPSERGGGVNGDLSGNETGGIGVTPEQSGGGVNGVTSENEAEDNRVTPAQSGGGVNDVTSENKAVDSSVTPAQSGGGVNGMTSENKAVDSSVTPAQSGGGVNGVTSENEVEDNGVTPAQRQSGGGVNDVTSENEAEDSSVTLAQSDGGVNDIRRGENAWDGSESGSTAGGNGGANDREVWGADRLKLKGVFFCSLFFLILVGLVVTVALDQKWSTRLYWVIVTPVSLVVLAICWTPKLQEATVINNYPVNDISGPSSIENNTTCWKLGIITNFIKVAVWAFCVFLFYPTTKSKMQNPLDVNWHIVSLCSSESYAVFAAFLANVLCGGLGYLFAILALMMKMQFFGLLVPIFLSNMGVILFLIVGIQTPLCDRISLVGELDICTQQVNWEAMLIICILVSAVTWIGMGVQLNEVRKMTTTVMEKESSLFYTPGYNSVLLDQWLILSRREMRKTEQARPVAQVFICTTMYREVKAEMKQLMDSLWNIAENQTADTISTSKVEFEAHIFFDDGCKEVQVLDFALQLLSIIDEKKEDENSLISDSNCKKWRTPYGLQLQWKIPCGGDDNGGMNLTLHLKDNNKVKNKKRWSQVMYMSYVLDYVLECPADNQVNPLDRDTYILATDADVKFSPESAMALLDLARRDPTVGAVCGRTHPLGSGPMVWYQKFDYAVGHWFQKTANSVLGSVLCCPGCFSVYRAEALRQALVTYSSGVSSAMEFLMKDMGEDRWLCTLMVSNGWRLEYTAVSEDSTYCPEEFDEFFNQRRRWGPSTVANQVELLKKYFTCGADMSHDSVSFPFMVYQGLLFFSGLIGPATCVLIIAGGLEFFSSFNGTSNTQTVSITTVVVLSLVCLLYGLVCLRASKEFQLKMAMFLSLCFAILMTLVLVSLFRTWSVPSNVNNEGRSYIHSASTLSYVSLAGIYVTTGLLHITEFHTLLYGLVYFLSLPTSYMLLTLYSVCNLTDRTWGTRERSLSGHSSGGSLTETISDFFALICGRSQKSNPEPDEESRFQTELEQELHSDRNDAPLATIPENPAGDGNGRQESRVQNSSGTMSMASVITAMRFWNQLRKRAFKDVKQWLRDVFNEEVFVNYADKFVENGYSNTDFITGMTDEDLVDIGIDQEFHRRRLLGQIRRLPEFQLETAVPNNVTEWLKMLNLQEYTKAFQKYGVDTKGDLACLRQTENLDQVMQHLEIEKRGHIKRLKLAISAMKEPDELEKEKYRIKRILLGCNPGDLKTKGKDGNTEWRFWEELRTAKLDPELAKFSDNDLKEKLIGLRNSALAVMLIVNVMWITIMMVLSSRPALQVLGHNPMGFLSLAVFGLVQVIQFLAMLYHRMLTLLHAVARI